MILSRDQVFVQLVSPDAAVVVITVHEETSAGLDRVKFDNTGTCGRRLRRAIPSDCRVCWTDRYHDSGGREKNPEHRR